MDKTVLELRKVSKARGHALAATKRDGDGFWTWCRDCQAVLYYYNGCQCHGVSCGGGALLTQCGAL